MAKKINVFNELESLGLCYAVLGHSAYINNPSQQYVTDWVIVGSIKDKAALKKLKFILSKSLRKSVLEYEMSESELKQFKDMTTEGKFNKVLNNKEGKVYELKNNSFREYYKLKD